MIAMHESNIYVVGIKGVWEERKAQGICPRKVCNLDRKVANIQLSKIIYDQATN